jgi:hypothetical protein
MNILKVETCALPGAGAAAGSGNHRSGDPAQMFQQLLHQPKAQNKEQQGKATQRPSWPLRPSTKTQLRRQASRRAISAETPSAGPDLCIMDMRDTAIWQRNSPPAWCRNHAALRLLLP